MNLIQILNSRADAIPEGPHSRGLKAVVQHAQSAVRHLERGQRDRDDSAFTDAIYGGRAAARADAEQQRQSAYGADPETLAENRRKPQHDAHIVSEGKCELLEKKLAVSPVKREPMFDVGITAQTRPRAR